MSRAEASRSVRAVADAFEQHLHAILNAAHACPPGGGQPWDGILAHYGFGPDPPQTRLDTARDLGITRGATPDEVRRVLAGLEQWAREQLAAVASIPFAADDPAYMTLVWRVAGLAHYETERYRASVVPNLKQPTVSSIFANASATASQTPWADVKVQRVAAIACWHCGAPQETPMDFVCRYCRQPMIRPNP